MSRLQRAHSPQGEFSRADHNPLAAQGTLTGTKLSQHTACMAATGTKLSPHTAYMATTGTKLSGQSPPQGQPVQNSPSTAKNAHFSPSSASRENFFPVQTQTTRAGRIFSRRPPPTSHAAHTHGTKLSQHPPPQGQTGTKLSQQPRPQGHNRYKTLPAQEKPPISAHLARAGRKLSRSRRKQPEQGELFPANHHPPPTQRTPTVQNSPRNPHLKTKPEQNSPGNPRLKANRYKTLPALPDADTHAQSRMQFHNRPDPRVLKSVGISRICHHGPKDSLGNCMRNCRASRKTAHKTGPVIIHRPRLVCISADASDYQARTERS